MLRFGTTFLLLFCEYMDEIDLGQDSEVFFLHTPTPILCVFLFLTYQVTSKVFNIFCTDRKGNRLADQHTVPSQPLPQQMWHRTSFITKTEPTRESPQCAWLTPFLCFNTCKYLLISREFSLVSLQTSIQLFMLEGLLTLNSFPFPSHRRWSNWISFMLSLQSLF